MKYAYKRGDFVEIVGARYGEIEGVIGTVLGTLSPCEGQPEYVVDVRGTAVATLEKDLKPSSEPPRELQKRRRKRIKRVGVESCES